MNIHKLMNMCWCFEALVVVVKGSKVFAKDHKCTARPDTHPYIEVPPPFPPNYLQSILMAPSTLESLPTYSDGKGGGG